MIDIWTIFWKCIVVWVIGEVYFCLYLIVRPRENSDYCIENTRNDMTPSIIELCCRKATHYHMWTANVHTSLHFFSNVSVFVFFFFFFFFFFQKNQTVCGRLLKAPKRLYWNMQVSYVLCMGHAMPKCVCGHMRTAKAQIRLRIRAVWSGPSLSANRIIGYYRIYEWRAKARMTLCAWAWWSKSARLAHARKHLSLDVAHMIIDGIWLVFPQRSWTGTWFQLKAWTQSIQ